MGDEEEGFKVVDRRTAGRSDVPSGEERPTQATPAQEQLAEETAAGPQQSAQQPSTSDEARSMPDPGLLLTLAAMQMDVTSLIASLTAVFDGQAWRAMGLRVDEPGAEPSVDLRSAKLAIDCYQFLLSQIENELEPEDRRELQRRLSDLRLNYLSRSGGPR